MSIKKVEAPWLKPGDKPAAETNWGKEQSIGRVSARLGTPGQAQASTENLFN